MSYKSVKQILNAVFDSEDSSLKGIFKTDGEVLNMVLDESGDPALKVKISGASQSLSEAEKTELAKASRNYLINPLDKDFVINQRGYVSGTALSAGVYGYDRWKASGESTVITFNSGYYELTSGTIAQVIEATDLTGETLTLSADCGGTTVNVSVDGQSGTMSDDSPFEVTIANSGNITVTLSGGKVRDVKLGYNNIYLPVDRQTELARCERYCYTMPKYRRYNIYQYNSDSLYVSVPTTLRDALPQLITGGEGGFGFSVQAPDGTFSVGYTISVFEASRGVATILLVKTSHGLTGGFLRIRNDNQLLTSEL